MPREFQEIGIIHLTYTPQLGENSWKTSWFFSAAEETYMIKGIDEEIKHKIVAFITKNKHEIMEAWTNQFKQDLNLATELKLWITIKKLRVLDKNYNEYHENNTDLKQKIFTSIDKIWNEPTQEINHAILFF